MFRLKRAMARRQSRRSQTGRRPLVLEGLEDRTVLSPTFFTVNALTDTGTGLGTTGDLRYVISQANANQNPAGSVIQFDPTIFRSSLTLGPPMIGLSGTMDLAETAGPEVIEGPGASLATVSDGTWSRVFRVDSGVTATIEGLTITGGAVTGDYGGGIQVGSHATLSLIDCSISGDSATSRVVPYGQSGPPGYGGGIANAGTLTISGTTISGNTASGGGGIWNTGVVTMSNTTVAGNSSSNGGGIANSGTGMLTAVNCTIADNSGAGLSVASGGKVTLDNTIVAANTQGDIVGTVSSSSAFNLIGTGGAGGLTNGVAGNQVGVADPGLRPLFDSDGPTPTISLLAGSPAIDKGSNALAIDPGTGQPLATDQRGAGFPRILNGTVDIGAFEGTTIFHAPQSVFNLVRGDGNQVIEFEVDAILDKLWTDPDGHILVLQTLNDNVPINIIQNGDTASDGDDGINLPERVVSEALNPLANINDRLYGLIALPHEMCHAITPSDGDSYEEEIAASMIGDNIAFHLLYSRDMTLDEAKTMVLAAFIGTSLNPNDTNQPVYNGLDNDIEAYGICLPFQNLYRDLLSVYYSLKGTGTIPDLPQFDSLGGMPSETPVDTVVVTVQPSASVTAGAGFGMTVAVEDDSGNIITSYNGPVWAALTCRIGGATLGGTLTVTAQNGVATFSGLTIDRAGIGYTLQVSGVEMDAGITQPITVTSAAVSRWVVTAQPPGTVAAGSGFGLAVAAENGAGSVDTSFGGTVTVSLAGGPGGASLGGTYTATAVNGVARFSALILEQAGTGYTLQVGGSRLATASTAPIAVTAAPAFQLAVAAQPPAAVGSGAGFGLTVAAEDVYGNRDPSFNGVVTAALASNPGGATLGGPLNVAASGGLATFAGLTLDRAGTGYTLQLSGAGLLAATTAPIGVMATPEITQLVVTVQPPGVVSAGSGFGLVVTVENAAGQVDTSFGGTLTVGLASNPGGSGLGGTLSATARNGVASFSGLTLNRASSGYVLWVYGGGLAGAETAPITVIPAAASQFVVTGPPPGKTMAGSGFGLMVVAEDPFGNVATSFGGGVSVGLAANPGGAVLGGTVTVAAVNGVAIFNGLTINRAGTGYTLQVSSPGLAPALAGSVDVVSPTTIIGERIVTAGRGRKRHLVGFELIFSAVLDVARARAISNYSVSQTMTRIVKHRRKTIDQPVHLRSVIYNPVLHAVDLVLAGKAAFAKGGKLLVNTSPPMGITDSAGNFVEGANFGLPGGVGRFAVLPRARGLVRSSG